MERTDQMSFGGMNIASARYGQGRRYNILDHLGSPAAQTYAGGGLANQTRYLPFGMAMENPNPLKDHAGFTGHIKDSATGLNYMQARYYDPVMGRFLSIDPVTMLDTGINHKLDSDMNSDADMNMNPEYFNRYSYTANDPVNAIDPNGESSLSIGGSFTISKPRFIGDPNINIVKVGLKFSISLPVPILDPTAEFDTGISATIGGGGGQSFGLKGSLDGSAGPGSVTDLAGRSLEGEVHIIAAGGAVSVDKETGELSEVTASIGPGITTAITENQTFTLSLRNGLISD